MPKISVRLNTIEIATPGNPEGQADQQAPHQKRPPPGSAAFRPPLHESGGQHVGAGNENQDQSIDIHGRNTTAGCLLDVTSAIGAVQSWRWVPGFRRASGTTRAVTNSAAPAPATSD